MTEYMVICVGTRLARIRNFRNIEVESHVIQVIRAINGKKKKHFGSRDFVREEESRQSNF